MTDKLDNKSNDSKRITFDEEFDKLNLKSFAEESLLQIMEKGTASSIGEKGAWTISLNAEFGNGKTTFLKMFQHFIEDEKKQDYNIIFINAWESDFYGEPIIAILSELSNYIKKESKWKYNSQKIVNIIGKIGKTTASQTLLSIAQTAVQLKTGLNLDMKQLLKTIQDSIGEETFKKFNQRKTIIQEIKTVLLDYTKNKKLIIIVDELDRARPDYAVHFLEDIKHFFDIENVVFLVGVNRQQMEATVKCLYGKDLKFEGYYRKFFKQEIELPNPYREAYRFIDTLIKKTQVKYQKEDKGSLSDPNIKNSYLCCKIFNLTLREIEYFLILIENCLFSDERILGGSFMDIYSFFICLFIKEKKEFNKILVGNYTVDDFFKFLDQKQISYNFDSKQDITLLLGKIGYSLITNHQQEEIKKIKSKFKIIFDITAIINPQLLAMYNEPICLKICKNVKQSRSAFFVAQ